MMKQIRVIETMKNIRTQILTGMTLALSLVLVSPALIAQNEAPEREPLSEAEQEEMLRTREAQLASIEKSRREVERNAEEARQRAEAIRQEAEQLRAESAQMARQSSEAHEAARAELAKEREELSRVHRELRRATQEVARAHRELSMAENQRTRSYTINLGDRAVLGVVLGRQIDEGLVIVGISPDGPAERAGIERDDVLISIRGEDLSRDADQASRRTISEVMNDIGDGEEISVEVLRDGQLLDFMIKPEKREPTSWASRIRLPDPVVAPTAPSAPHAPDAPDAPHVVIEQIAIPPVDTSAIAAEALALAEEMKSIQLVIADGVSDASSYSYSFDMDSSDFVFDTEAFSEFGSLAMEEAHVWFGSGATMGLRFAEMNEGLAGYFDTEDGVLVLEASDDNEFGLEAGDVLLQIGDSDINSTADFVRALRDHDSGDEVDILIRRKKRDVILDVVIPDNRLGLFDYEFFSDDGHTTLARKIIAD